MKFPAYLIDGDTGSKRRYPDYETAIAAGLRAYDRLIAAGKYADDTFYVSCQGATYGVAAIAANRS